MSNDTAALTSPDEPFAAKATLKEAPDALIGTVIDARYQVDAILGDGGMGIVYAGHHVELGRQLAIKVLRREIASSEASMKRFRREAMAATRLSHQHIVTTLDYGNLPDGSPYLIMEKLSGSSLKSLLEPDVPMDTRRAVRFARQLAGALDAAHEAGVVHRDLKPENVQVVQTRSDGDVIKVLDFGIAKVSGATQLTATGSIVGTPRYMSPEQCRGEAIDARADI
jgi:serine/threonine-protein kinase